MAALGQMPALMAPYTDEELRPIDGELMPQQAPWGMGGQPEIDQQQLEGYTDPRRALWGGFMMDMANHFLSGRRAGLGGLGPQSMFAAIRQNQQLEQQAMKQRELQSQVRNPFQNMPQSYQTFQLAKQGGYDGAFEDWLADVKQQAGSNRPVKTWTNSDTGTMWYLDSNGQAQDTGVPGDEPEGLNIVDVGGVPYVQQTQAGGAERMIPLNEWQRNYRLQVAGDEQRNLTQSEKWAAADASFEQEVPMLYNTFERQLALVDELIEDIENGRFQDTGYFEGRYRGRLTEEGGYLTSLLNRQALENLQIVNLAPVTEQEFETVRDIFGNILNDPQANLGALKANRDFLTRSMNGMQRQLEWFYGPGQRSMRDFNAQKWMPQDAPGGGDDDDPIVWDDPNG